METLLSIATALAIGLLMSRVVRKLKLPAVTGYLIAGILIGPYVLGRLGIVGLGFNSQNQMETFKILSEVALGFIAFTIGNEFRLSQLKSIGRQAVVIGIAQAVVAAVVVDIALIGLHFVLGDRLPMPVAIVLGAIATATAPAATLMVVRQYKAKGKVTDILLPVVALDDAVGLVIFAISFGVARAMIHGQYSAISIIIEPLIEILASLLLGFIMGSMLTFAERYFNSRSKRMATVVTAVIASVGLSMMSITIGTVTITFSSLLVCMMVGTAFCNENEYDFSNNLMERTERWATPILIFFFVISGAELELSILGNGIIVLIGVIFIIARSLGKYYGAYFSAKFTKCDPMIVKYLGITLLPQAGVALGMAAKAQALGVADGQLIRNIVLFAVLIYELVGPYLTKVALIKSGDIKIKDNNKVTKQKVPIS